MLKPGDKVEIFEDPLTKLQSEGIATLVRKVENYTIAIDNMERWVVRFYQDGVAVERNILTKETWQQKDYRRQEVLSKAIEAADDIIMQGSAGSEEETDYFAAAIAMKFMEKVLHKQQGRLMKYDQENANSNESNRPG